MKSVEQGGTSSGVLKCPMPDCSRSVPNRDELIRHVQYGHRACVLCEPPRVLYDASHVGSHLAINHGFGPLPSYARPKPPQTVQQRTGNALGVAGALVSMAGIGIGILALAQGVPNGGTPNTLGVTVPEAQGSWNDFIAVTGFAVLLFVVGVALVYIGGQMGRRPKR
jgi:hypothetical protein